MVARGWVCVCVAARCEAGGAQVVAGPTIESPTPQPRRRGVRACGRAQSVPRLTPPSPPRLPSPHSALSLALPTSGVSPASLLAAGVLPLGDGLLRLAQGTMRTAWTVARTAGAGADYVNVSAAPLPLLWVLGACVCSVLGLHGGVGGRACFSSSTFAAGPRRGRRPRRVPWPRAPPVRGYTPHTHNAGPLHGARALARLALMTQTLGHGAPRKRTSCACPSHPCAFHTCSGTCSSQPSSRRTRWRCSGLRPRPAAASALRPAPGRHASSCSTRGPTTTAPRRAPRRSTGACRRASSRVLCAARCGARRQFSRWRLSHR